MWTPGTLHASPHRIATLSSCVHPQTVLGLRSFIGAYKVLGRVIPQCSKVLAPLESCIAGRKSQDVLHWSDNTREAFRVAQNTLSTNRSITLPRPSDELWIVTDGSVTQRGIGSRLYVSRHGQIRLAGFFSAKLKKHRVKSKRQALQQRSSISARTLSNRSRNRVFLPTANLASRPLINNAVENFPLVLA